MTRLFIICFYFGECWDKTTKLQYLRARWYDPSIGRFINEDTYHGELSQPLTLNLYTYVGNNPLTRVDPTGNIWETILDILSIGSSVVDLWNKPSWENAGYLAWDVAAAAVPGAPGSYVAKGAKFVDKAASSSNKVIQASRVAQKINYSLSKSDIKHFSKHIPDHFSREVAHLSDDMLNRKLKKNTFFNPNWTKSEILDAVQNGANEALSKGFSKGKYEYTYKNEIIKIFFEKGNFESAYGSHRLTPKDFGR